MMNFSDYVKRLEAFQQIIEHIEYMLKNMKSDLNCTGEAMKEDPENSYYKEQYENEEKDVKAMEGALNEVEKLAMTVK